jgi:choice-of-anchor B domain-containing protein
MAPPLVLAVLALASLFIGPARGPLGPASAAAADPPRRMEEVTPATDHFFARAHGMWGYSDASGEYALVTDGAVLLVVDVTDPGSPQLASRVQGIGWDMKEVKTFDHYALCVNQNGPLQIVDLSDPYHAYTAATYLSPEIPGAHNAWVDDEGFAYLAMQGSGPSDLRILDLTDPLHPVPRGHWAHPFQSGFVSCHDVFVRDNLCYASWFGGGLVILDVTNKDQPQPALIVTYPEQQTHNAWPTLDGRHVATTDEMNGGHLRIWEIGPSLAQQVAEYATAEEAIIHNVHVKGTLAYIAYYSAGVRVVDLADPLAPREVGAFDTSDFYGSGFLGCWSVYPYAPSGLIYASDINNGLYVLRYQDANDGVLRGALRVEGAPAARVAGAEVKFLEAEVRVVTDATGYFEAKLYPGPHTARIRHPDFQTRRVEFVVAGNEVTNEAVDLRPLSAEVAFPVPPEPVAELPDGRLRFAAQVRGGDHAPGSVTLHYRAGASGSFRSVDLVPAALDDERYSVVLQTFLPGTLVQYYFEARAAGDPARFVPNDAPFRLFSHEVGRVNWQPVYSADFEGGDGGFAVGSATDWGTRGRWERGRPVATPLDSVWYNGRLAQPNTDTTPTGDGYCFLTQLGRPGGSPGAHRVQGRTTLTSPVVDMRGARAARLRASVWFVNDLTGSRWQDAFLIQWTTDDGATWRPLETIRVADPGWQSMTFDLGSRIDLATARELQVRFIAEDDLAAPTLVEAAVDDIRIEISTGITVETGSGQAEIALLRQNLPNPFNPKTLISFQLKEARSVSLAIYDVAGHLVRQLVDGPTPAGDHAVTWDGRDGRGFLSPSGVYYYELAAPDIRDARTMLLLK